MKFRMYLISKVLISNLTLIFKKFEPKSPNLGIFDQKIPKFSNLNEILSVSYFEGADFKCNFRSR